MDKQNKTVTKSSTDRPITGIKTKTTLTQNPTTNSSKQNLPVRTISKPNTENKSSVPNKSSMNVHTSINVTGTQSKSNTNADSNAHIEIKSPVKSSGTLLAGTKNTFTKTSPDKNVNANKTLPNPSSDNTLLYKFSDKTVTNKPMDKPADIFVLDSIINAGKTLDHTAGNVSPGLEDPASEPGQVDLDDEEPFMAKGVSTSVLIKKISEEKVSANSDNNAQGLYKASSDAMNVYIKEITNKVVKSDDNQEKEHEEHVFYKNALNTSVERKDNDYQTFSIEPTKKWSSPKIKDIVDDKYETSDAKTEDGIEDDNVSSEDDVKIKDGFKTKSQIEIEDCKKMEIDYKIEDRKTKEIDSIHDSAVRSFGNPATSSNITDTLLHENKTDEESGAIDSKSQAETASVDSKKKTSRFYTFFSRLFGKKAPTSETGHASHIKVHKARTSKHIKPSTLTKISETSDNARTGEESASSVTSTASAMKRTLNPGAHDCVNVEVETTAVVGDAPITQTESKGEASLAL